MKLYATVTSERASKGQGGNKQINIAIYIDNRTNPRYRLFLTKRENDDTDIALVDMERPFPNDVYRDTIKGKKQTGDMPCNNCGGKRDVEALICNNCKP